MFTFIHIFQSNGGCATKDGNVDEESVPDKSSRENNIKFAVSVTKKCCFCK